jgi:hypothetical protein
MPRAQRGKRLEIRVPVHTVTEKTGRRYSLLPVFSINNSQFTIHNSQLFKKLIIFVKNARAFAYVRKKQYLCRLKDEK